MNRLRSQSAELAARSSPPPPPCSARPARPIRFNRAWKISAPWIFLVLLLIALPGRTDAQPIAREYQLKAVFLYNFTQFVEWPTNTFTSTNSPFIIGVLGHDPFGRFLDEAVRGESVGGRPIIVQRYSRVEEIGSCHLLYVNAMEVRQLGRVLEECQGRPILTVSDIEGSAVRGIMIRFLTERNRIRLRINLDSARAAGLTISSKLLRTAEVISREPVP